MGIVFGRVSEERPLFDVVHVFRDSASLPSFYGPPELRKYAPRLVSEYAYDSKTEGTNEAFRALARYIGVFGTPENRAGDAGMAIAMTAPVTMGTSGPTKVSMTAPVTMGQRGDAGASDGGTQVMQFGMPRSFKSLDECPRPTNPRVSIREIPTHYCIAVAFNGSFVRALAAALPVCFVAARTIPISGARQHGGERTVAPEQRGEGLRLAARAFRPQAVLLWYLTAQPANAGSIETASGGAAGFAWCVVIEMGRMG
jgi:hypothetical protein